MMGLASCSGLALPRAPDDDGWLEAENTKPGSDAEVFS
jgi:hypothetical protein